MDLGFTFSTYLVHLLKKLVWKQCEKDHQIQNEGFVLLTSNCLSLTTFSKLPGP